LATGQGDVALTYFEEYKQIFYNRLSPGERQKLDSLIVQCRQK
jgi:hypothetical protein